MIKVEFKDLKKALGWVEANTNSNYLSVAIDMETLVIRTFDKFETQVEIVIYSDKAAMQPKITRTEIL